MKRAVLMENWACITTGIELDPTKPLLEQESLPELTNIMNAPHVLGSLGCRGENLNDFLQHQSPSLRDLWGIELLNETGFSTDPFNKYLLEISGCTSPVS